MQIKLINTNKLTHTFHNGCKKENNEIRKTTTAL